MGRIEIIKSFFRGVINGSYFNSVKTDSGGGPLVTPKSFNDAGDDSQPLQSDYAVSVEISEEGSRVIVGYIDPQNAGVAGIGEKRIYSRESGGTIKAEIHLKNDGSILISNDAGQFELESGGDCVINGCKITTAGEIFDAFGNSLSGHLHTGNLGNPVSVAYTPPMPPT